MIRRRAEASTSPLRVWLVGGEARKNAILVKQLTRAGIDVVAVWEKGGSASATAPKHIDAVLYMTWCAANSMRNCAEKEAARVGATFLRLRRPLWPCLQEMVTAGWLPPLPADLHPRVMEALEREIDDKPPSEAPAPAEQAPMASQDDAIVMDRAAALMLARANAAEQAAKKKRTEATGVREKADLLDMEADELDEKARRLRTTAAEFEEMLKDAS